jgi:hypothetical protein
VEDQRDEEAGDRALAGTRAEADADQDGVHDDPDLEHLERGAGVSWSKALERAETGFEALERGFGKKISKEGLERELGKRVCANRAW